MKKYLRLTAAILSLLMLFALAACGGTGAASPQPSSEQPSSVETNDPQTAEDPQAAEIDWPTKTLEIVVPYKAGGDTDFHARTLAKYLEPILGQSIIVTNIEGASGTVGMQDVMDSDPDGYKMLYFHESMLSNKASGLVDYAHEALDLCAASVVDDSYVLVVDSQCPYQTLDELIEAAKEHPGEIAFASSISGYSYMVARMLEEAAGIDLNVCDAGGTGDRNTALLSHKMQVTAHVYGGLQAYIESGDFRVLAALGEERNELFPDIPTAKEQGVDLVCNRAYFLSFPKGTDPAIIDKMEAAIKQVCEDEAFIQETIDGYTTRPVFLSTEDLKDRLDANLANLEANPSLLG